MQMVVASSTGSVVGGGVLEWIDVTSIREALQKIDH